MKRESDFLIDSTGIIFRDRRVDLSKDHERWQAFSRETRPDSSLANRVTETSGSHEEPFIAGCCGAGD